MYDVSMPMVKVLFALSSVRVIGDVVFMAFTIVPVITGVDPVAVVTVKVFCLASTLLFISVWLKVSSFLYTWLFA